jgi:hypothetical protein
VALDHVVVFGDRHLLHLLRLYYNGARTHLSLKKDAPELEKFAMDPGSTPERVG